MAMIKTEALDEHSLREEKQAALAKSASAQPLSPGEDVREKFGFMPLDVKAVQIHWPELPDTEEP